MTGLILYMYEAYMYEAEEISYLHKVKTKDHFLSISTYLIKYAPANLQKNSKFLVHRPSYKLFCTGLWRQQGAFLIGEGRLPVA